MQNSCFYIRDQAPRHSVERIEALQKKSPMHPSIQRILPLSALRVSGRTLRLRAAAMAVCGFLMLAPAGAATSEIAGVKVQDTTELAGASLMLNGAGIRYKGPFKVYVAALYLGKKVSTPEAAYAAAGPKRIALTMLRDMDSGSLGRLFMRGMQDNTAPDSLLKVLPALPRMGEIFAEQPNLASGDSIIVDWVPGTGTVISVNGKVLGQPSKDPEFFHAMLAIWLGKNPADWMLKDALLGVSR